MERSKIKPYSVKTMPEPRAPRPMGAKAWVLYILVVVAIPCAFLIGAEIALRLFHAGYDPRFFLRMKGRDGAYCVDNPSFGRRFFPSTVVRISEKLRFPLYKSENERRIFVLGSSAAQGEPAPAFAFSRDLDCMLRGRYGPTRCEVINTAITAINSPVVVPIARECSRLSPDIMIVYMGNNEVIGPFGPGTIFSHFSSNWFIRLRVFLSSTRLGQLASAFSESIAQRKGVPAGWGGMKMFLRHKIRFDDPKMDGVYRNFRDNLREICRAARNGGARVVLCTVASNLKDCGPFFSMHRTDLSPVALKQWEVYYEQAVDSQRQGQLEAALTRLRKASALDSTNADMRYRTAQCLAALGHYDEARRHFIAARDYDALRFRADSRINQIIKEVAREFPGCAVVLDLEERLAAASDHGICGEKLFLEHVHFNFHGNYLVASSILTILDSLIAAPVVDPHIVSEAECRERLAFTPWEELSIDREMRDRLTKPPFTGQYDNLRRAQTFLQEIHRLSTFAADSEQNIIGGYQRAASLEPRDWYIEELLGKYLLLTDSNAVAAEKAFRMVLDTMPHNQFACNNLAIALERQGRTTEAIGYYREAIRIAPLFIDPYVNIADDLAMLSRRDEAEKYLTRALDINPGLTSARERFERLRLMHGKPASAIQ
jgi:Flp pilus assembly protein TadD